MNRVKQLKNKIDQNFPEIVVTAGAIVVTASLAYAAYCNEKMSKFDGAEAIVDVRRTPGDEVVLFLSQRRGCLVTAFENLPVIDI